MAPFPRRIALITPFARTISVAALLGSTMFIAPPGVAYAASAGVTQLRLAQSTAPQTQPTSPGAPSAGSSATSPATSASQATPQAAAGNTAGATTPETVDQRIASLHAALQITPAEESKWDNVAKVMRANATHMETLIQQRDAQAGNITAVQDLQEYEKFAQAHVADLRKLTRSFDTLYEAMPAAQKKVADQVFENFGHHKTAAAHS